jgi:hypothetical protein
MRRSVVALAIAAALSAAPQAQRGDVRLRVVDLDSDAPILRAQLTAGATDPLPPTFSDEHGLATVNVPPAGRTIRVSKPGYVAQSLKLTIGSELIDVRLARGAVISGRIVDTLGAPVVGRPVLVTASAQTNQQPQTVRSDDRGEYRIGTLPDGTYTVSLNAIASTAPGTAPPIPDALPHTVVLRRGEEVGGIDFTIASRSTCRPPPAFGLVGNASVFSTITGRVTAADGTPLGCVEVVASRGGAGPLTAAITAADGRYVLERLRAGTYRIEFARSGYVTVQWGQVDSGEPGRQLVLRDREHLQRIDMSMSRGGAITGTLTDEFGEPVENVKVRALQLRGEDERSIAIGTLSAPTDDRGRYRLFALLPGRYIVATEATADPPDRRTGRGYAPAYYPGTVDLANASPVEVGEQGDRQWIDFVRVPTRVVTITGTALNSKNDPVTDRVILVASQRSGAVIAETQGADVIGSDGAFTISNVPPGDYVVQAASKRGPDEPPEFGRQFVTVGETDPLPMRIQTRPGIDIQGRLIEDGVPVVDPRLFSLMAVPVDWDQTSLLTATERLEIDSGGLLSLRGVTGPRRFVLTSAPFNWYLKSVSVRGRDVTDEVAGFPTSGLAFVRDLEVVVSNKGGTLEGDALDGSTPVTDYSVVLFSSNPDHWFHNSRFLKTTRGNTTGKFRIEGVPDGDYYAAAVDPLEGSAGAAWQDRNFLQSLITSARRVRLRAGEGRTISLTVVRR